MGLVDPGHPKGIRSTKATASLEVRRKKAAWSTAYLARLLRSSA